MPWPARECCVFGSAGEGSSAVRLVAFADVTATISQRMMFGGTTGCWRTRRRGRWDGRRCPPSRPQ